MVHDRGTATPRARQGTRPASVTGGRPAQVLPILRRDETPAAGVERALTAAATSAAGGDAAARDALFAALAEPIAAYVARYRRRASTAGVWDLDDVRQEAYLAFVDVVGEWSGETPFHRFFAVRFPRRLADAVRRLDRRPRPPLSLDAALLLHDGSAAAEASLALLEALAADLPEPDRSILLLRVRDGCGIGVIAGSLALDRRTVRRRLAGLGATLRASLSTMDGGR